MRWPGASARIVRAILALALLVAVVSLNVATLIDAYGSGPPYHGRTVNMDKWADPLPWLVLLDLVVLATVLALVGWNPGRLG